jgi:nitroimidazol reductase NimA-like FMN-containing flavoprotein (pyridoxamine 5'-phosphate oxidase superfamily)
MADARAQSELTRVKRLPERGRYDRETVHAILDAGFVCHVGYAVDGHPVVTPTSYWREDDHVYFHGSSASRMLRTLSDDGVPCCLTVTHTDGLVLARSAFHHSVNYRSVMLFGTARPVTDEAAKARALEAFVERLYPGRWATLRPMTAQERKATSVLRLEIDEASAKIRAGAPKDDEEDYALPIWAGVVPLTMTVGQPVPDDRLAGGVETPEHVRRFRLA